MLSMTSFWSMKWSVITGYISRLQYTVYSSIILTILNPTIPIVRDNDNILSGSGHAPSRFRQNPTRSECIRSRHSASLWNFRTVFSSLFHFPGQNILPLTSAGFVFTKWFPESPQNVHKFVFKFLPFSYVMSKNTLFLNFRFKFYSMKIFWIYEN